MTPEEYRNRALAIAAATAAFVRSYFQFLPANVDDSAWRRFLALIYPEVMRGRLDTFNLSVDYYLSQRPNVAGPPPEFVERRYPLLRLDKALTPPRARLTGVDELTAEEQRIAAEQAESIAAEHVMADGRETVEDAVKNDGAALGWARVPSGDETCAFCTMLVSRGPVYKTRKTASLGRETGEPYHPNCDCVPVPVFDRDDWPGRDAYIEAQRLWYETTGGRSGTAALNALRRHLYAEQSAS
jgi:hypothetical protein